MALELPRAHPAVLARGREQSAVRRNVDPAYELRPVRERRRGRRAMVDDADKAIRSEEVVLLLGREPGVPDAHHSIRTGGDDRLAVRTETDVPDRARMYQMTDGLAPRPQRCNPFRRAGHERGAGRIEHGSPAAAAREARRTPRGQIHGHGCRHAAGAERVPVGIEPYVLEVVVEKDSMRHLRRLRDRPTGIRGLERPVADRLPAWPSRHDEMATIAGECHARHERRNREVRAGTPVLRGPEPHRFRPGGPGSGRDAGQAHVPAVGTELDVMDTGLRDARHRLAGRDIDDQHAGTTIG
jgi:hypothetical protein